MSLASFFKRMRGGPRRRGPIVWPRDIPTVAPGEPATIALRTVLSAYGVDVDPAKLDEECGVNQEGANINDLERVARAYGIDAEQVMVPPEHVLASPRQLPAIAVCNDGAYGLQFFLLWRVENGSVQVLGPTGEAHWEPCETLAAALHRHDLDHPAETVAVYLRSEEFVAGLSWRMGALDVDSIEAQALLDQALKIPSWRGIAALDAATRHLSRKRVSEIGAALRSAFAAAQRDVDRPDRIPSAAFFARGAPPGTTGEERVFLRGAVIVKVGPS